MDIERGMTFSSQTMMGRDEAAKVQQVLLSLNNTSDSLVFREPVNWQELGLVDYPVVIKNPMDLGTVKKKVQTSRYNYVEDCLDDINLIWANAKLYNPKENEIHKIADKLEKQTKKMIKNYLPFVKVEAQARQKKNQTKKQTKPTKAQTKNQQPKTYLEKQEEAKNQHSQNGNEDPEEPEHITKRKNLLYLMQLCNSDQIGVIFLIIRSHCPNAVEYDEEGNVNIKGENISEQIAARLNGLMEMWGISMKNVIITTNNRKK